MMVYINSLRGDCLKVTTVNIGETTIKYKQFRQGCFVFVTKEKGETIFYPEIKYGGEDTNGCLERLWDKRL